MTTTLRVLAALGTAVLVAGVVAVQRTWAAFPELGGADGVDLFRQHFETKWIDYGPSLILALLTWAALHRLNLRDAKYAMLVGAFSFYFAPRVYAALYLAQSPYWSPNALPALLIPSVGEILIGASLALVMWVIAYWRPASAARMGAKNAGVS